MTFNTYAIFAYASENEKNNQEETQSRIPDLKAGKWEPIYSMGKNLFPSVVISTITLKNGGDWDTESNHLGENWGTIGIAVCSPKDNCSINVEISSDTFIKPTTFIGTLPKKGITYFIFPDLKYEYEKLLMVSQKIPEDLTFKVSIDRKADMDKTDHIQVRSINECVYYFVDYDGNSVDTPWFFAAYVNENHPYIHRILADALKAQRVSSFSGTLGNIESQLEEINAIWETLKKKGIRYSNITTTDDDENPELATQYVRLIGQSINYSQANCVDGSVLLASILRKIGFNVSLITVPGHMYIGLIFGTNEDSFICIETTMIGNYTLEEAIEEGTNDFTENESKFLSDSDEYYEYNIINIMDARAMGIISIKDSLSHQL
ncbi:MAG TPA: hypothetical protein DD381_08070 [Lentisphaeria bacterium]|nr:MAG: hypothetical protein A2X47_04635 [Lentisphaerae bacterium GWF2_38_69]HBM16278.1 hypothetical protein [Lentisphaeria bacterium]